MKALEGYKSDIVEQIVKLRGEPVSFLDYPISREILNCDAQAILMIAGRQVAKSFTNGVDILGDIMTNSWVDQLYVAPTVQQTKAFSTTKISTRIRESPFISKWFINKNCTQNVFEKSFATECRIHFRAATQLEAIRGLEARKTRLDEIQDFTWDEIIIIEAVLDGQKDFWKYYSGTAKTLNNPIEILRRKSNQIVPVLVCPECGYHNIPYLDNIKPQGLFCKSCKGGRLSVRYPYFKLQSIANKGAPIVSFWIPQVALPLHVENDNKWADLYRKFAEYPQDKFLNECMGISAGTSFALITEEHLGDCCSPKYSGFTFRMSQEREPWHNFRLFAGVDWAITQKTSFTVISIGGFNPATQRLTFAHISKILNPDPEAQKQGVIDLCRKYKVAGLACDWGSGYDRNIEIRNRLLTDNIPVYQMMYTNQKMDIIWDQQADCYKLNRTKTLSSCFQAIRNGAWHFPEWIDFQYFAPHYLAEYIEEGIDRNGNTTILYDHDPATPDDALHSGNYLRIITKLFHDPRNIYKY